MKQSNAAARVLFLNTVAFTICFAAWTLYGVLIAFLIDQKLLSIDKSQVGLLIGTPILSGAILRLPVGILADRFGGKPVYLAVMLASAAGLLATSFASTYIGFLLAGLLFGISGASFAVGVAYTSIWFPKERQGTALGLFGMGNLGTALTALGAPTLLSKFTNGGANPENWSLLPQVYAAGLVAMAIVFALLAPSRKQAGPPKTLATMLKPLRSLRVWRFGLYYFLLFGGFVSLAQWLIPYFINVYGVTLATAGLMATMFSLPSGITRAVGGFLSDRIGARTTLYIVLSGVSVLFIMLIAPRMEITSPGEGILAEKAGVVTEVGKKEIVVGDVHYELKEQRRAEPAELDKSVLVLPKFSSWQEPVVAPGDEVKKRQLLARGFTHVFFQANQWIFSVILMLAGVLMGLGMAAVYKHIPEYFPQDVGVVGGLVGVIGGLGGFLLPVLFGYALRASGLWTTCWLILATLAIICLVWMHIVILKSAREAEAHE